MKLFKKIFALLIIPLLLNISSCGKENLGKEITVETKKEIYNSIHSYHLEKNEILYMTAIEKFIHINEDQSKTETTYLYKQNETTFYYFYEEISYDVNGKENDRKILEEWYAYIYNGEKYMNGKMSIDGYEFCKDNVNSRAFARRYLGDLGSTSIQIVISAGDTKYYSTGEGNLSVKSENKEKDFDYLLTYDDYKLKRYYCSKSPINGEKDIIDLKIEYKKENIRNPYI